jgi:Ser/Thr protein kinase RdoA (MazF antagonist)
MEESIVRVMAEQYGVMVTRVERLDGGWSAEAFKVGGVQFQREYGRVKSDECDARNNECDVHRWSDVDHVDLYSDGTGGVTTDQGIRDYFLKVYEKRRAAVQAYIGRMDAYMPVVVWLARQAEMRERMARPLLTVNGAYKWEDEDNVFVLVEFVEGETVGFETVMTADEVRAVARIVADLHRYGGGIHIGDRTGENDYSERCIVEHDLNVGLGEQDRNVGLGEQDGLANDHKTAMGAALEKIRETFDVRFGERLVELIIGEEVQGHAALARVVRRYESAIVRGVERVHDLAEMLRVAELQYVLCHTDVHGGNVMRVRDQVKEDEAKQDGMKRGSDESDGAEEDGMKRELDAVRMVLVDWEGVRWAPAEADLFAFTHGFFWGEMWEEALAVYREVHPGFVVNEIAITYYRLRRRLVDIYEFVESILYDGLDEGEAQEAFGYLVKECSCLELGLD